ncbi:hypothetical protein QLX67_04070 [Balneolaceae bacterium ANBcel3]|nr:hypothetical protein [Balneolaceae bacterium ANBcel3]
MHSFDDNHIWDEHEWEAHIDEMTQKHQHLREVMEPEYELYPRWLYHLKTFPTKIDAVDAFIEEELLIEEANFPLDDEEDFEEDDLFFEDEEPENEDSPFNEEGLVDDDVESLFEDIYMDEHGSESHYDYAPLENITVYTEARDFSADLLLFHDNKPAYLKHPGFIKLVSDCLQLCSKLAAAYSMGFDVDVLGANIAYCKKALYCANEALSKLQKLKSRPVTEDVYFELHRRLYELRNNIAIHIQDTRDIFNEMT